MLDAIPIGYAVTYIFGTIGSAIVLAQLGPKLIGVDLAAACAEYETQMGGGADGSDAGRPVRLSPRSSCAPTASTRASGLTGKPVRELFPGLRIFVERVRRGDEIIEADADTVLQAGDIVAISGRARAAGRAGRDACCAEVDDRELLDLPADGRRRVRASKAVNGKTLRELAERARSRAASTCARSRATWSRSRSCPEPRSCAATS